MHDAPYIRIPLYRRDGSVWGEALVDAVDAHLAGYRWSRAGLGERANRGTAALGGTPSRKSGQPK